MKNMQRGSRGKKDKTTPDVAEAEIIREDTNQQPPRGKVNLRRAPSEGAKRSKQEGQKAAEKEERYTIFDYSSIKSSNGSW